MSRVITYAQAINEALDYCMEQDDRVILMGEGHRQVRGHLPGDRRAAGQVRLRTGH